MFPEVQNLKAVGAAAAVWRMADPGPGVEMGQGQRRRHRNEAAGGKRDTSL